MVDEWAKEHADRREAERVDADVFISYKRSDRPKIAALAEALRRVGLERVWYDASLLPGHQFDEIIEANANACQAMIVCWTNACFADDDTGYVRWEASIGHQRGKLVPIALEPPAGIAFQDEVEPQPIQWDRDHIEDLSHWLSAPEASEDAREERMERIGAHGPLSDPGFRRVLYRLGEPAFLNRPGLAELSSVYEAFEAAGEPDHAGPRTKLEAAVRLGRRWLLDHANDAAAERLARELVDYEYAALGAQVLGDYGSLLGVWTPPDAEGGRYARGLERRIDELEASLGGKNAHIAQLHQRLDRAGETSRRSGGLFGRGKETAATKATDAEEATSPRLRQGAIWRDRIDGLAPNALPEMVALPPGTFLMGAPEEEDDADSEEFPRHEVRIAHTLAMGRYALTFAEWDAARAAGAKLENPSDRGWGRDRRPVINVSWEDAHAYLDWLNTELGLTGRTDAYRLPSEAEWEYACRAGTTTAFSFGETISTAQANYDGNYTYGRGEKGEYREKTTPAGSFPANAFGLHDMHGNVWEWCADPWHDNYDGAPKDGSAWEGRDTSLRVRRGGSWNDLPRFLRSAYRSRVDPTYRFNDFGFRVARTVLPE